MEREIPPHGSAIEKWCASSTIFKIASAIASSLDFDLCILPSAQPYDMVMV